MIEGFICWLIKVFTGVQAQWAKSSYELTNVRRVYFANHTSHLDFLILWACLPNHLRKKTRPVAAHDYWSKTPIRLWLVKNVFRAILIERKNVSRANNPIEQLSAALKNGDSLIIFPEGTRGNGEQIGNFKSGLYHLAKQFPEACYIPVYLDNLNRVLPKGELIPLPLICSVIFGSPLSPLNERTKDEYLEEAKTSLETLTSE